MKHALLSFSPFLMGTAAISAGTPSLQGLWQNPKDTVEVRIAPCGSALCGSVVAASPSAIADARESGYPTLVGMRVLYSYNATGVGRWKGAIFVPDIGRTVNSRIELIDPEHIRVSGCLLGNFFCKSQLWRRV